MDQLKSLCTQLNITVKKALEFGAAHPRTTQLKDFIHDGVECILVEANPRLYYCLVKGFDEGDFKGQWPAIAAAPHQFPGFGDLPNVKVLNVAISNSVGKARFYECNASSFLENAISPAKVNDHYVENEKDVYIVDTVTTDMVDPGDIDLLAADVEGCEYHVLERLISRPKLICLETHSMGGYVNPRLDDIQGWMERHGYDYKGSTESDSIYVLR